MPDLVFRVYLWHVKTHEHPRSYRVKVPESFALGVGQLLLLLYSCPDEDYTRVEINELASSLHLGDCCDELLRVEEATF